MTVLTLLVKASHGGQLKQIDELLSEQFADLDVEVQVLGRTENKWVQISLTGEDESVATSYVKQEIGICPVTSDSIQVGEAFKGYISRVDTGFQKILVDIGVFEPKPSPVTVSLVSLQTHLAFGKDVGLKKIAEMFGLADNLPIDVKIVSNQSAEKGLEGELSSEQVQKLHSWQESLLDRLIVLGASKSLVDTTLERTHLYRDVIEIEELGIFEHALTCKLGTEAAGIIPRIGRYMRNSVFIAFSARKSLGFLGEQGLTL